MFSEALPFIISYVCALAQELRRQSPVHCLSSTQQNWIGFCLTAMLLTNSLCSDNLISIQPARLGFVKISI